MIKMFENIINNRNSVIQALNKLSRFPFEQNHIALQAHLYRILKKDSGSRVHHPLLQVMFSSNGIKTVVFVIFMGCGLVSQKR